jgi:hypothetical protein
LLLSEVGTCFLNSCGERDLDILGHRFLGPCNGIGVLRLAHHLLNPLDTAMAIMETLGDILREPLYLCLLRPLGVLIVEAG